MNRGLINRIIINGRKADPVVRVRVDAKGVARVRTNDRVLAYCKLASTPTAQQTGRLGRVEAHLSALVQGRAVVDGVIGRLDVRSLLAATGRVVIEVTLPPVYLRAKVRARAAATVKAHVLARNAVLAKGIAQFTPTTRRGVRGPTKGKGVAKVQADGTVYVRRWLRSPVDGEAQAFIVTTSHIEARLASLVKARALVKPRSKVLRRSPVNGFGVVHIEIDPEIHKRLPFDEPAPDSRTFRVPEAMTIFYVTDQGNSMFRVSPPMQPADTQDYDIEFDGWFPPGDEIVSVSLKVEPAMPMPPSYAFVAQRVKVWVYAGGANGQKYKISVKATTNDGRQKEVELIVPIKEL